MEMKQPFEKVVEGHGATVLRVCRAVVGPVDAEDVWQETFLAALRAYPDLPADANTEAWLVTIAHRKSLDAVRAVGRRPVPVAEAPEEHSPHGIPDAERAGDGIWAKVARLPDKQRRVIAYRYLADLPFNDIAEILGGSPAAARRAASDGIRSLRAALSAAQTEGESA
ncbi:sigma-70 family RNA polymerase sigma factor [Sinomonas sp. JGH33]|uniref:Sigma-70 family RNA polymerase sigma factor n=1 Tax=Sinomonas terricola TaxID=3110330 RepID=A0ABU5T9L1_9MICC|nr:sigma-70 family RNA polymerase sigma factor [Sinomonas sp. JGH33]MEA5456352.1 sigma-70 family RNA polymerase sigma factor [Sinomonas sp. JGH33]